MDKLETGFYQKMRQSGGAPVPHAGDTGPKLIFDKSPTMHRAQRKADELAAKDQRDRRRYNLEQEYSGVREESIYSILRKWQQGIPGFPGRWEGNEMDLRIDQAERNCPNCGGSSMSR